MGVSFARSSRAFIDPRTRVSPAAARYEASDADPVCDTCDDQFPAARAALGYSCCLRCAPTRVPVANMAMHKQAATYTANLSVISENQYAPH